MQKSIQQHNLHNPYTRFMYAIKSPETKKRYPIRFKTFLDYVEIPGSGIEERLITLYDRVKQDSIWLHHANVDRIWLSWQSSNPGQNPDLSPHDQIMDPWGILENLLGGQTTISDMFDSSIFISRINTGYQELDSIRYWILATVILFSLLFSCPKNFES